MNSYPPQPPQFPPQLPPPGGYNPYNPYQGYDVGPDYIPWLAGRKNSRYLPMALIVGAVLLCSCCAFLFGIVVGIELPGFLAPSSYQNGDAPPTEDTGGFHWQVTYPKT